MKPDELAGLREAAVAVDIAADALAAAVAIYDGLALATVLRMKRAGEPVPGIPAITDPRRIVKLRMGSDLLLSQCLGLTLTRPPTRIVDLLPAMASVAPTKSEPQTKPPIRSREAYRPVPVQPSTANPGPATSLRDHDPDRAQPKPERREGFIVDEAAEARFYGKGKYTTAHRDTPEKRGRS